MSPRAAWRLESLGFTKVFDLVIGKAGWAGAGFPLEGAAAGLPATADAARRDVFTCKMGDPVLGMSGTLESVGQSDCVVLNEAGIIMGRTRRRALDQAGPGASLEEIMELGPTTVRPDERLDAVVERMRRRGVSSLVVATQDGRLVGILHRDEAERLLGIEGSEIERE